MIRRLSPPHKLAVMPQETRAQLVKQRRGALVGMMSEEWLRLCPRFDDWTDTLVDLELARREALS